MSVYPKIGTRKNGVQFARPADTTAYASGDLVANSTTPGSVVPIVFANVVRQPGYSGYITRAGLRTNLALIANGSFRLHLFSAAPTVTNGDNGALDVATNLAAWLGSLDITLALIGTGQGTVGVGLAGTQGIPFQSGAAAGLWGLLEARAAYVPASGQTFTPWLDVDQF